MQGTTSGQRPENVGRITNWTGLTGDHLLRRLSTKRPILGSRTAKGYKDGLIERLTDNVVWPVKTGTSGLGVDVAQSLKQLRRRASSVGRRRKVITEDGSRVDALRRPEEAQLLGVTLVRMIEVQLR